MRNGAGMLLPGSETVSDANARASRTAADYFVVDLGNGVWGGLSRAELTALGQTAADSTLAGHVKAIGRPYLYPDQSLETALRVLQQRRFVPVVHRADHRQLEGVLALDDVLQIFRGEDAL